MSNTETTDIALFVRTSREDIISWDRRKIIDALILETNVDINTADEISKEVEKQIVSSGISLLTAPLIRELVDAKLIERGLEKATKMHARLGFPLYDVGQLILYHNKENANIPHSPEGTNLTLAEGIKKEYAILNVFSDDVAYAHMVGDIHLHNLGYIDRPHCSYQSIEYIKKFGLSLPSSLAVAAPARHAETLVAQMVRFAAALQGNFAAAIIWDAVNLFFAPYLEGLSDREVKQCAQMLIYEFAQQAVARGGQTIFTDLKLYWEVPRHFETVPAIGPGVTIPAKRMVTMSKMHRDLSGPFSTYLRKEMQQINRLYFPDPSCILRISFFLHRAIEIFYSIFVMLPVIREIHSSFSIAMTSSAYPNAVASIL